MWKLRTGKDRKGVTTGRVSGESTPEPGVQLPAERSGPCITLAPRRERALAGLAPAGSEAGAWPRTQRERRGRPGRGGTRRTQGKDACSWKDDQSRGWERRISSVRGRSRGPFLWALLPRDPTGTAGPGTLCSGCESWLEHPTLAELQLPV